MKTGNTYIKEGDKIYYDGNIYEATGSISCRICVFYDTQRERCRHGICSRYANTLSKPIVFKHFSEFKPIYLDLIKWSSDEQKKYVYDFYKQQIEKYRRKLVRELSKDD